MILKEQMESFQRLKLITQRLLYTVLRIKIFVGMVASKYLDFSLIKLERENQLKWRYLLLEHS